MYKLFIEVRIFFTGVELGMEICRFDTMDVFLFHSFITLIGYFVSDEISINLLETTWVWYDGYFAMLVRLLPLFVEREKDSNEISN